MHIHALTDENAKLFKRRFVPIWGLRGDQHLVRKYTRMDPDTDLDIRIRIHPPPLRRINQLFQPRYN